MEGFARESPMGFTGPSQGQERRCVESAEMGSVVCMERSSGMTLAGEPIEKDILATMILRGEDGDRRVVHHHTDRP